MMEEDQLIALIKTKAAEFAADNLDNPTQRDLLIIEQAMLIGAGLIIQQNLEAEKATGDQLKEHILESALEQLDLRPVPEESFWKKVWRGVRDGPSAFSGE